MTTTLIVIGFLMALLLIVFQTILAAIVFVIGIIAWLFMFFIRLFPLFLVIALGGLIAFCSM